MFYILEQLLVFSTHELSYDVHTTLTTLRRFVQQDPFWKVYVVMLIAAKGSCQVPPLFVALAMFAQSSEAEVRTPAVAQTFSGKLSGRVVAELVGFVAMMK